MKDRKVDSGKPRVDFVVMQMPRALLAVSKVSMHGAKKYGSPNTWQGSREISRYEGALLRHLLQEGLGEEIDPESGIPHAAAVAWNALVRLELILRRQEELDRHRRMRRS